MKTKLCDYNKKRHYAGRSSIICIFWFFINAMFFICPLNPFSGFKIFLLRLFGAKIGKGVIIKPSVNIKYPWKLVIGDYSWIGECVWIDNLNDVIIGSNCCISQGAMLLCGNHNYKKSSFDLITKSIILEDGVWIGALSVVCPGVICKSHSVLYVKSVATATLNENTIYQGNPAIAIRNRYIE